MAPCVLAVIIAFFPADSAASFAPGRVVAWGVQTNLTASLTNVVALAAGRYINLALTLNGTVMTWWSDESIQTNVPAGLSNVIAIAAGDDHGMALQAGGKVTVWGNLGDTNVPAAATNLVAIAASGGKTCLAVRSDGSVITWVANGNGESQEIGGLTEVVAVAAGYQFNLALRSNGTVVGWGYNAYGQVTVPPQATNVVAISAGSFHSLALRRDGSVIAWGHDDYGLTTIPTAASNVVKIAAGGYHNLVLRSDGLVVGWGANYTGQTPVPAGLRDVTAISAGYLHSLALTGEGLPLFAQAKPRRSVFSGSELSLDAKNVGGPLALFHWRLNGSLLEATNHLLRMGPANATHAGLYSVEATSLTGIATGALELTITSSPPQFIKHPSAQTNFVGAVVSFSVVAEGNEPLEYQWFFQGESVAGATNSVLGLASIRYDQAGPYFVRVQNALGDAFSSNAFLTVNSVAAWGNNAYDRTNVPAGTTNIVAVGAGAEHTIVLTVQGGVRAWGGNTYGEINVPPDLTNTVAVATSHHHNLALRSDGTVTAWGVNNYGQTNVPPGLSNVVEIDTGSYHSIALRADGTLVAWGENNFGQTDVPPDITNIVAIAAGTEHNLALLANGRVRAWGRGDSGQLAVPLDLDRVVAVSASALHALALRDDGTVVAWGAGAQGQASVPVSATNVIAVSAGSSHSLALRIDGTVLAWGSSAYGETNVPTGLANVVSIAAGEYHAAAAIGDGRPVLPARAPRRTAGSGSTIILNAMAAGIPPLEFQWQYNGTNIDGATSAWLALTNVQATQGGLYRVLVWNAVGSAASETLLTVEDSAPVFLHHPQSVQTYPGGTVQFEARAIGAMPINYQWLHDGVPVPDATNQTLVLNPVNLSHRGGYVAVAQNAFGSASSSNATLSIPPVIAYGAYTAYEPNCSYHPVFVPADLPDSVMAVAGGYHHSMALLADGTVRAWGVLSAAWCDVTWGQTNVPSDLTNVVAIAAGAYHSLALRADGTVVGWGKNSQGQCTAPAHLTNVAAIAAGEYFTITLSRDGTVAAWGFLPGTNALAGLTNVMAISAGPRHGLALREDGTVVAWGSELATNVPPGLSNIVAISAGYRHSLALRADGAVVSWGSISAVPSGLTNVVALAGGLRLPLLKADGTLSTWGCCEFCWVSTCPPAGLSNVVAVAAGLDHTLALVGEHPPPSASSTAVLGQPRFSNGEFTLSFPSVRGRVYALEVTSSLNDSTWTTSPLILGDGSIKELSHQPLDSTQQFYRVRRWR